LTALLHCENEIVMDLYRNRKKYYSNIYPEDLFQKLEFDKILEILEEHCESPLGVNHVRNVKILIDKNQIEKQLRQVYEFAMIINNEAVEFPSNNFIDLKPEMDILEIENSVLLTEQVFRIYKVLLTIHNILHFFFQKDGENEELYPELTKLVAKLEIDKDLLNAIKGVIDENGKIKSSASRELTTIRNNIGYKYQELDGKFKSALNSFKKSGFLDDTYESIRNGRRVLAVLSSYKRKVKGLIMDETASGRVTFIEPEATLQINNELFELQQEERREIHKILRELSQQLRPHVLSLKTYQKLLAIIDFIRAKAKLANSMNAVMPLVTNERIIELNNAFHPLLYLLNKQHKKKTVPINLRLSIADRLLVISGPNAGGKSVTLKTVGLLQLMLQTGMLLPLEEGSLMSLFENFFADIGDEQSLENDLSTYSSRLLNMRYFTEHANSKTMVFIDEFGSGTDPKFGGAIAESVLEMLNKKRVYGVITTHYSNIKIYASETRGLINGTMNFDKEHLRPLYKLEVGRPGSSFAFEIAESCGLPNEVLENARKKVGAEYKEFDELLSSLQNEKAVIEAKREDVEKREKELEDTIIAYNHKNNVLKKKKQSILLKAEEEALSIVNSTNKKFDKMLLEWSQEKKDKEVVQKIKEEIDQDRQRRKGKVEKLTDAVLFKKSVGILKKGANVQLRSGNQVGTVLELNDKNATVAFGLLRTTVKLKELVVVNHSAKKERGSSKYDHFKAAVEFSNSIDVRGMRRDEALNEVETFLDNALLVDADFLKIIHGKGDGILRRSIRELLRKYDVVKSIKSEDPQYGGDGISIVELG